MFLYSTFTSVSAFAALVALPPFPQWVTMGSAFFKGGNPNRDSNSEGGRWKEDGMESTEKNNVVFVKNHDCVPVPF